MGSWYWKKSARDMYQEIVDPVKTEEMQGKPRQHKVCT